MLQDNIDKLLSESIVQRERLEKSSSAELKLLTDEIRQAVIRKEREYEDLILRVQRKKKEAKLTLKQHKKLVAHYDAKYDALNEKRRNEIRVISSELRKLREMISSMEAKFNERAGAEAMIGQVAKILNSMSL